MGASAAFPEKPVLLVLASTYPRWSGDTEPGFVHELARRLTDRFRVVALVPHSSGARTRECLDGVQVIRFRYALDRWETLVSGGGMIANLRLAPWKWVLVPGFMLAMTFSALAVILRTRPAVVHAHWLIPQGAVVAVMSQLLLRAPPFVVTSHGADLYSFRGSFFSRIKRWIVARAATVTVVSEPMRKELAHLGAKVDQIHVRPMGIDLSHRFTPDDQIARVPGRMLFVGRLVEKKGVEHLLRALPLVMAEVPVAELWIAGFGPERPRLQALVEALGLSASVRFLGAVPQTELPALLRSASLLVSPFIKASSGDEEGLGLVVAEALGCGCPVLAGDVAAMNDYGVDVVNVRNPEALSTALIERLRDDAHSAQKTEALRLRCLERLDWPTVAVEYGRLLIGVSKG